MFVHGGIYCPATVIPCSFVCREPAVGRTGYSRSVSSMHALRYGSSLDESVSMGCEDSVTSARSLFWACWLEASS